MVALAPSWGPRPTRREDRSLLSLFYCGPDLVTQGLRLGAVLHTRFALPGWVSCPRSGVLCSNNIY